MNGNKKGLTHGSISNIENFLVLLAAGVGMGMRTPVWREVPHYLREVPCPRGCLTCTSISVGRLTTALPCPTALGRMPWGKNRFLRVTCAEKVSRSWWTEECTPGLILRMDTCVTWTWVLRDYKSACKGLKWLSPMSQSQAFHSQSSERTVTFNTSIFFTLKPTMKQGSVFPLSLHNHTGSAESHTLPVLLLPLLTCASWNLNRGQEGQAFPQV